MIIYTCEKCGHVKERLQRKLVTCKKCDNNWYTRLERPIQCSFCKSLTWDKDIQTIEKKLEAFTEKGETWKRVEGEKFCISSNGRLYSIIKNKIITNKEKQAQMYHELYFLLA